MAKAKPKPVDKPAETQQGGSDSFVFYVILALFVIAALMGMGILG